MSQSSTIDYTLTIVLGRDVADLWPICARWIRPSVDLSDGEYTMNDVKGMVVSGEALLAVAERDGQIVGAGVLEIHILPRFRLLHVLALGGRHVCTRQGLDQLRRIGRTLGCSKIQGWAKKPQMRLYRRLGMRPKFYVMRGDI